MLASLVTIFMLFCEIFSEILAANGQEPIAVCRVLNLSSFVFSPLIPYFIIYFVRKKPIPDSSKPWFNIPLVAVLSMVLIGFRAGWLDTLGTGLFLSKGPLPYFVSVVTLLYFSLVIFLLFDSRHTYGRSDKIFLVVICLLPFFSLVLQSIFPTVRILWSGVSMALLLFYVFTLEQNFEYDNQTEVRNREGFERAMRHASGRETTLFVFDLNNLKKTNDMHGHKAGDALLYDVARTIEEVFADHGDVFRIGGDEFCVLCNALGQQETRQLVSSLARCIEQENEARTIPIDLAFGFTVYRPREQYSIFTAFSRADNAMYEQKMRHKHAPEVR
jgi:diguanylate cyclase (GGDEF)-like protein